MADRIEGFGELLAHMRRLSDACHGKHGYPSKATADQVAARSRKRRGGRQLPYRCDTCGLWHIGNRNYGGRS